MRHANERFVETYAESDMVFEEGSTGREMFVVQSGWVRIVKQSRHGLVTLATLGPGEVFGEMALVDCCTRSATAIAAADDTRLVVIDQARFVYLVSQQPTFALAIMQVLSERVRALGAQLACN